MNLHPLERMKGSVIKDGKPHRIVYALTKKKVDELVEQFIERGWVPTGERYMVERYLCQKMVYNKYHG